jgi:hypothetical protein
VASGTRRIGVLPDSGSSYRRPFHRLAPERGFEPVIDKVPERRIRTSLRAFGPLNKKMRHSMSDDLNTMGAQDRARVSIGEDHEIAYWTAKFGVSREKLAEAVDAVGNSASAVGDYLAEND